MRDKFHFFLGRYAAIALGASILISVALDNVLFVLVLLAMFAIMWWRAGRMAGVLFATPRRAQ